MSAASMSRKTIAYLKKPTKKKELVQQRVELVPCDLKKNIIKNIKKKNNIKNKKIV